tara:strand:+ start:324 stop:698 length:375 start_codon:yes stop_codon:yes gene_type:complete
MSEDQKEEKKQVYFLDCDVHTRHFNMVTGDILMIRSHINHHTSDEVKAPPGLISDLCEYYCALEGFARLLTEIKLLPVVPAADDDGKEEYVLGGEQALLLKFYLPLLVQFEDRTRRHNLSLAFH